MSWGWRKVLKLRPIIREFICYTIGDGSIISLWYDRWCHSSPLSDVISTRDIFRAGLDLATKVRDVDAPDRLELEDGLGRVQPFSVRVVWNSIRPRDSKIDWCDVVWFTNHIPRHAFNLWLIMKKKLKTQDMIYSWDVSDALSTVCPLCELQPDSHQHLFFDCSFSKQVWNHMKTFVDLPNSRPDLNNILSFIRPTAKRRSSRSFIANLFLAASCYFFWQERNSRLFKNNKKTVSQVIACAMDSVRLKLMSCHFKKSNDGEFFSQIWRPFIVMVQVDPCLGGASLNSMAGFIIVAVETDPYVGEASLDCVCSHSGSRESLYSICTHGSIDILAGHHGGFHMPLSVLAVLIVPLL
ncbi:hypothetical protein Tco_0542468 [Tanacetum coccineum]